MPKTPTIEKIDPQVMRALEEAIGPLRTAMGDVTLAGYLLEMADRLDTKYAMLIGDWPPTAPDWEPYWLQAWEMWPVAGKRRSSKSGAKGHFGEQSRKIGPQALLDAINRYVLSPDVERDDGAYTPALDRWLRQKKWEVWLEDIAPKRVGFV